MRYATRGRRRRLVAFDPAWSVHEEPQSVRRHLGFASFGQRLLSLVVLGVFAYLIWLAVTGRFDHEVNRVAHWLQSLAR